MQKIRAFKTKHQTCNLHVYINTLLLPKIKHLQQMKLPSTHKLYMSKGITRWLPVNSISQNKKFCHQTDYDCHKFVTKRKNKSYSFPDEFFRTRSTTSKSIISCQSSTSPSSNMALHFGPRVGSCNNTLIWVIAKSNGTTKRTPKKHTRQKIKT